MSKTSGRRPPVQNAVAIALRAELDQGLALHQQGKLAEAERIYRKVLRQQPNRFDALHLLGVIAVQTGRPAAGAELIQKAISLNATIAVAHSNLGNAFRDLKRPEDALASYDRAIALEPDNPVAHINRGNALADLKRPEDALASYAKAIALKPNAAAYFNHGNALRDLKRSDDALSSYVKAIV
jgi:tetratricopeptide (TPR) repeat protein